MRSVGNRRATGGMNRRVSSEGQAGRNTPTFCTGQKSQDRGLKSGILATSIKPDPNLQIENKALEMGWADFSLEVLGAGCWTKI